MIVEYAGILAGLSLLAATLTGAYGQNVTAVFAADGAGVAAVGKAAHVQHVPSAGARAAYKKAPSSKPALRYLFALGWIGGTRNKTACGVTLLGEGAARIRRPTVSGRTRSSAHSSRDARSA